MKTPSFTPLVVEIGHMFKQAREHAGLSMYQVSKFTGLVPSTLSRLERGHQESMDMETFLLLCVALEVEPQSCFPTLEQTTQLFEDRRARQPE